MLENKQDSLTVGEQVTVAAPSGDASRGLLLEVGRSILIWTGFGLVVWAVRTSLTLRQDTMIAGWAIGILYGSHLLGVLWRRGQKKLAITSMLVVSLTGEVCGYIYNYLWSQSWLNGVSRSAILGASIGAAFGFTYFGIRQFGKRFQH